MVVDNNFLHDLAFFVLDFSFLHQLSEGIALKPDIVYLFIFFCHSEIQKNTLALNF